MDGSFRIMDLEPGNTFVISIESDSIETVMPAKYTLQLSKDH